MKLSKRTAFSRRPSALSAWLSARGRPELDLTESNPTRCGLVQPEAVARLAHPGGVRYAPDPRGAREVREAVARYYARRGAVVDPDRVVVTTSSSEAYGWLFKLLCDPGEVILAPSPSYPLFPFLAGLEGVALAPYRLSSEERWRIDEGDLDRALAASSTVRGILAVSPANPTGQYLNDEDAALLERRAHERSLSLIVDEVFHDFSFAGPWPSFTTRASAFVLSGLSKVALLPQLKLGWIVVGGLDPAEAMARLEMIADTYLSVSSAVQHAAPAILDEVDGLQAGVRARLVENLAALDRAIEATGSDCPVRRLPVEGGWYALVEIPRTRSDDEWVMALVEREEIVVQPGYFYDLEADGVMVVSLLLEPSVFAEAIGRAVRLWASC